jgi:hypothetical protein
VRDPIMMDSEPGSHRRRIERDTSGRFAIRKVILLIIVGVCLLGTGCQDVATVWTAEVRSPDGFWVASARTEQHGGPGTADIDTIVYLKWTKDSNPPHEVLGFDCGGPVPRPRILDNVANAGGTINLAMKWVTPSHLEVSYDGRDGSLYFQVVKIAGIDISVRDLSSKGNSPSP